MAAKAKDKQAGLIDLSMMGGMCGICKGDTNSAVKEDKVDWVS